MTNDESMTNAQQMFAETEMIARMASMGIITAMDPDIAEHMGAFEENALSAEDAEDSRFDVDPDTGIVLNDLDEGESSNE